MGLFDDDIDFSLGGGHGGGIGDQFDDWDRRDAEDWRQWLRRAGPGLRRVADFRGRSARADFWWYTADIAFFAVVSQAILLAYFVITRQDQPWSVIFASWWDSILWATVAFEVLIAAAVVRRLHDTGRSGRSAIVPLAVALFATWAYGRAWKATVVAREEAVVDAIDSIGTEGNRSLGEVVDSVRDATNARAEFGHIALAGVSTAVAIVAVGLLIVRLARAGTPGTNDHGPPPTDGRDVGAHGAVG